MVKTDTTKKLKVHFMGIGGSALSGVAVIAKKQGFIVSGCDMEKDTAYMKLLKKHIKKVTIGHNKKHLENADILVVSPSVLFINEKHPEVQEARKRGILMTWQEFLGKYLQKNKEVVCISGTHGKSTTTALAALMFENANLDPSVVIGAKIIQWGKNYRIGRSNIFITEADEFYDNFLNYTPSAIIVNNIEMDHPDYFKSEKQVLKSFKKFINKLTLKRSLILNLDSENVVKLYKSLTKKTLKNLTVYGYTLKQKSELDMKNILYGSVVDKSTNSTSFVCYSKNLDIDMNYKVKLTGEYNISNTLGIIILAKIFQIDSAVVGSTLSTFEGLGRRLELISGKEDINIFDDYAHHPTAISKTISALKQRFPTSKIWVVVEPHSYSRTKVLLNKYENALNGADKVIIGPIFKARDKKKFGVSGKSIVKASGHNDIVYINNPNKITDKLKKEVKPKDVIAVMGAGDSYKWAKDIANKLK